MSPTAVTDLASPGHARFVDTLTERERDVLRLLMDGRSNASIAQALGISLNTVRTHVHRVLTKLGVCTRVEAAAVGRREGLASPWASTPEAAGDSRPQAVRILAVGDLPPGCGGLQAVLPQEDLMLLAHVLEVDRAVAAVEHYRPDVALIGDAQPGASRTIGLCPAVKRLSDPPSVLVLGECDDTTLARALVAGADGYATPALGCHDILRAIRGVHAGEVFVPDDMRDALLRGLLSTARETRHAVAALMQLTRRERDVLALLAHGSDRRSVAVALAVSPETARTHIQHVLDKLGVHSQLEAVALATRLGLGAHTG